MILKLNELRVAAFAQFARKSEDHCGFVDVPKTYFSQRNQMIITLS